MTKRLIMPAFIMTTIVFYSCRDVCSCKKVPCPAFSNVLFNQWFPYDSGRLYRYSNQINTDSITIGSISKTEAYEASRGCYNSAQGCGTNVFIYSAERYSTAIAKLSILYAASSNWDGAITQKGCTLTLYDFSIKAADIADTGLVTGSDASVRSKYYSELILNNKSYQHVQLIERIDTPANKTGISKIYIQQNTGVLAYQNYSAQSLWLKK